MERGEQWLLNVLVKSAPVVFVFSSHSSSSLLAPLCLGKG